MGAGVTSISTAQRKEPAAAPGPPFPLNSAENGLSVDPVTGRIVLGNNNGLTTARLLSLREIPLNTFALHFTDAAGLQDFGIGYNGSMLFSFWSGTPLVYLNDAFGNRFLQVDQVTGQYALGDADLAASGMFFSMKDTPGVLGFSAQISKGTANYLTMHIPNGQYNFGAITGPGNGTYLNVDDSAQFIQSTKTFVSTSTGTVDAIIARAEDTNIHIYNKAGTQDIGWIGRNSSAELQIQSNLFGIRLAPVAGSNVVIATGSLGINLAPTAKLHIVAGTAAAGTAPLKFTSGVNLTAAEAGAVEWDGVNLFITQTAGPTRKTIAYTTDIPAYTFSTGLTNAANTITVNLSTGVAGGQSAIGGTASGNNLTLSSTSNATKGKIILGTASAYDQVNNRLAIGNTTPNEVLDLSSGAAATRIALINTTGTGSLAVSGGVMQFKGTDNATTWQYYLNNNTLIYEYESTGRINMLRTNTPAGTTGNQVINKPTGTVNIAAAGTTVTVTNSLCATTSLVFCQIRSNDTTATSCKCVPGAGSFVITLNAAATAEVSIGFWVINS